MFECLNVQDGSTPDETSGGDLERSPVRKSAWAVLEQSPLLDRAYGFP